MNSFLGIRGALWLSLCLIVPALVVWDPVFGDHIATMTRRLWADAGSAAPLVPMALIGGLGIFALAARLTRGREFTTLAVVALFGAGQLNGFGIGPLDVFDVTLFVVFLCWAATLALDQTRSVRLGFLVSVAFFIAVLAIAHLPVIRPSSWIVGMIGAARIFLIALLISDLCRDAETVERAWNVFFVVAVLSALTGIVQFILAYTGLYTFTLIDPPESAFKPTPLGFVMRASGLCITAQHFSSFLIYALPFAIWRFSMSLRPLQALGILTLLSGIFVSWNTGAIVAAGALLLVFPFMRWPERSSLLLVGLTVAASLAYFSGLTQLAFDLTFGDAGAAKGLDQRKTLFEFGLEQIEANPFVGTGLRGFGTVDGNFWHRPVHNILGQATAELGLFGLVAILAFFLVPIFSLSACLLSGRCHYLQKIALLAVLTALWLGQSEPNLEHSNLWLLMGLVQATIVTTRLERTNFALV